MCRIQLQNRQFISKWHRTIELKRTIPGQYYPLPPKTGSKNWMWTLYKQLQKEMDVVCSRAAGSFA